MRKLKVNKIIALLVISVIIVMLLTVKSEAATVTTALEATSSVQVGNTVSIYVTTTGTTNGIIGLQGELNYDTTKLEFVSCESAKTGWEYSYSQATGIFIAEASDVTNTANYIKATTATRVVLFKFKVKTGATGTANITLATSKATEATSATDLTTLTGSSNVVKAISIFVPSSNITIDDTNKVITTPLTSATNPITGNTVKPDLPAGTTVGTGGPGTGAIIKIPDPNDPSKTIDYTLLVKYDVTGDGEMNTADIMAMRMHVIQTKLLTGNFLKMAYINTDSNVDITDIIMMRMLILNL